MLHRYSRLAAWAVLLHWRRSSSVFGQVTNVHLAPPVKVEGLPFGPPAGQHLTRRPDSGRSRVTLAGRDLQFVVSVGSCPSIRCGLNAGFRGGRAQLDPNAPLVPLKPGDRSGSNVDIEAGRPRAPCAHNRLADTQAALERKVGGSAPWPSEYVEGRKMVVTSHAAPQRARDTQVAGP